MSSLQNNSEQKTTAINEKDTRILLENKLFWEQADYRKSVWKLVRRRFEKLKHHCRADSSQKEFACKRLTFISVVLESMEREFIETGKFEHGRYVALCNCFTGLLRLLGIEKQAKVESLQTYLKGKGKTA